MEHVATILCQRAISEAQTNNLSLIDVVDVIIFETTQASLEALPIRLELVSLWFRNDLETPETGHGRTRIVYSPDGQILQELKFDVDLVNAPRARIFGKFEGFPYVGNGIYRFVVQVFDEDQNDWNTVANVPLEIKWNKG